MTDLNTIMIATTGAVVFFSAGGILGHLRAGKALEVQRLLVMRWREEWITAAAKNLELKRQIERRNAPLLKQAAKNHAKRLDREARERLVMQARHATMRADLGELV